MKISQKLKLNSMVVLALLVLNITVAVFLVQRMMGDVRQLDEVDEPLEEAALEIEINAGETARAVPAFMLVFWFRCRSLEPSFQPGCTSFHPTVLVADSCLSADGLPDPQSGSAVKISFVFCPDNDMINIIMFLCSSTDMGLSISHGIVQDHRGELSVECEAGQYTRFHLDLPVDNGWEVK